MEKSMRRFLPVCLVFVGLIPAFPASAGEVVLGSDGNPTNRIETPTQIFTCDSYCVIEDWDSAGYPSQVRDGEVGGRVVVTPKQIRQRTNQAQ
ncbi:hypothetical protein I8748_19915 [Nostoc sp. CENA67]|uniref:Secreted protein n=1 Tax=Amazonocrinis nigriterrae CENA67 TaxID=2794033 RepID=A0A8J7HUH6_9NOST|nr:hypothetical protein [Amazonocrinis nigriterrae]MBH8564420.1 hypothetical protein [Amazonocrinis nigriterrae CENA67]